MKPYSEWQEWISQKSREYGGKNKFLTSKEYLVNYPTINKAHIEEIKRIASKGKATMRESKAKIGQRVYYDIAGDWGHVEKQEGIITKDKNGVPRVKIGNKLVKWHKGFKPII